MDNFEIKYRPKKIEDLICPREQLQEICRFIEQFKPGNSRYCGNLFISGSTGIGKSTIVDIIFERYKVSKIAYDLSNISVGKKKTKNCEIDVEVFYHSCRNKNISELISRKNNALKALVFDYDTIISNGHYKEVVRSLFKINQTCKAFPIIYISTNQHNKFTNELIKLLKYDVKQETGKNYKRTNKIDIPAPTDEDMYHLLQRIITVEKIDLPLNSKNVSFILDNCQKDIRKLLHICADLKTTFEGNKINMDKLDDFFTTQKKKDIDPGIYISAKNVMDSFTTIDDIMSIYNTERTQIPLMVHENYPENMLKQYSGYSFLEIIGVVENIADKISESDKIDGMIFTNQYWTLQNSHGFYSCVLPSYYANYLPNKNSRKYNIVYTKDFNRTSIKHNNCKYVRKFKKNVNLKNYKINDIIQLGYILKQLFDTENYEKIIEFGNYHMFSQTEILKLVKINKMVKYSVTFPTKTKNLLESSLIVKSKKEKKDDESLTE